MVFFSVIIPTYKRLGLLKQALNSLYAQTFKDFEIIVIGDDAVDLIVRDMEKEEEKRDNLRFFNLKKRANDFGATPRNKGVELSNGKYVAYLDDDSLYLPNHLERAYELIKGGKRAVISDSMLFDNHNNIGFRRNRSKIFKGGVDTSEIVHLKKLTSQFGGWNTKQYESDFDLVDRFVQGGVNVTFTNRITSIYYWRELSFKEVKRYLLKIMSSSTFDKTYTFLNEI